MGAVLVASQWNLESMGGRADVGMVLHDADSALREFLCPRIGVPRNRSITERRQKPRTPEDADWHRKQLCRIMTMRAVSSDLMGCATRIRRLDNHLSRAESPRLRRRRAFSFSDSYNPGSARPAASMQSAVRDSALRPAPPTVVLFPDGKRHGGPAGQARRLEPCATGRILFRPAEHVERTER